MASLNDYIAQAQTAWTQAQAAAGQAGNAYNQGYGAISTFVTDPTKLVQSVTVDSELLPQLVVVEPGAATQPGSTGGGIIDEAKIKLSKLMLQTLKPQVTVKFDYGLPTIKYAPYGVPGKTKWPVVKWGLIGTGAVVGFVFLRGIFK